MNLGLKYGITHLFSPEKPEKQAWPFFCNNANMHRLTLLPCVISGFIATLFSFAFPISDYETMPISSDLRQIIDTLGISGHVENGAFIVEYPRTDLNVTINKTAIPLGLGLVSWCGWKPVATTTMVIGDFVLLENEVNPFLLELGKGNITVTSLHNNFLNDIPRIMSLHILGWGSTENLVSTIRYALSKTNTPQPALTDHSTQNLIRLPSLEGASTSAKADAERIANLVGYPGRFANGVYEISLDRPGVLEQETAVPGGMGVNSWVGFAGLKGSSRISGDIAMTGTEIDRVLRVMRDNKIDIVAIHSHLMKEEPRVFFIRFWASGQTDDLAATMHDVLDIVKAPIDNRPHPEPAMERKSIMGYHGW